ncbi:MAG: GNAT family N-acetyltransferase [Actinobacteria bacterium]|nr:GNAT family N-acetyltransferase [Actinomycetota bacterium]
MKIRRAVVEDHGMLLDIWLRSVRATHTFLSEEDIQSILPLVRDHALKELEVSVLVTDEGSIVGFMGLSGNKMEALFLAPEFFRQGGGRLLVEHARELKGVLRVDVNEQNPQARKFSESLGFFVEGRSEVDGAGQPFPLLHMREIVAEPSHAPEPAARSTSSGESSPPAR